MAKEYVVQTSSNILETCSASSFSGPCAQHVVSFTPRAQRHQQQIPSDSPSWKLGTAEEHIHFPALWVETLYRSAAVQPFLIFWYVGMSENGVYPQL